jgi:HAD superfamily phosphatase (TIGR01668 family)
VSYATGSSPVALRNWVHSLKKAGIEPFILSNNHGARPKLFAAELSVGFMGRANKPSTKKLFAALAEKGVSEKEAAIIGDQVYTDVLCGKRAGILTIAVRPLDMKNPLLFLRYGLEFPFRAAAKRRNKEGI